MVTISPNPVAVTSRPLVNRTSHNTTDTPHTRKLAQIEAKEIEKAADNAKKMGSVWIPHVSVNPKYLAFYEIPENGRSGRTAAQIEAQRFLSANQTDGVVSRKATARINRIVSWFTALAKERRSEHEKKLLKYRLTFATLTLCSKQMHDDNTIKRTMLNRLLIRLSRSPYNIENYFWRAEAQENGNIHFHIILDKYIHHSDLRKEWNLILADFGYIEQYQKKMLEFFKDGFRMSENELDKRPESIQRAAYEKNRISNFTDPNTTDIHSLKFVKNIAAYISKYCAKNNRYFEMKSDNVNATMSELKKSKDIFDVKLKRGLIQFCMKRTDENKYYSGRELIEKLQINFDNIREKEIRDITGRLWYASESVLKMKNFSIEISSKVSEAIQYIIENVRGKWVIVSDFCRLFMFDVMNTNFEEENVKALFDPLLIHCKEQRHWLN